MITLTLNLHGSIDSNFMFVIPTNAGKNCNIRFRARIGSILFNSVNSPIPCPLNRGYVSQYGSHVIIPDIMLAVKQDTMKYVLQIDEDGRNLCEYDQNMIGYNSANIDIPHLKIRDIATNKYRHFQSKDLIGYRKAGGKDNGISLSELCFAMNVSFPGKEWSINLISCLSIQDILPCSFSKKNFNNQLSSNSRDKKTINLSVYNTYSMDRDNFVTLVTKTFIKKGNYSDQVKEKLKTFLNGIDAKHVFNFINSNDENYVLEFNNMILDNELLKFIKILGVSNPNDTNINKTYYNIRYTENGTTYHYTNYKEDITLTFTKDKLQSNKLTNEILIKLINRGYSKSYSSHISLLFFTIENSNTNFLIPLVISTIKSYGVDIKDDTFNHVLSYRYIFKKKQYEQYNDEPEFYRLEDVRQNLVDMYKYNDQLQKCFVRTNSMIKIITKLIDDITTNPDIKFIKISSNSPLLNSKGNKILYYITSDTTDSKLLYVTSYTHSNNNFNKFSFDLSNSDYGTLNTSDDVNQDGKKRIILSKLEEYLENDETLIRMYKSYNYFLKFLKKNASEKICSFDVLVLPTALLCIFMNIPTNIRPQEHSSNIIQYHNEYIKIKDEPDESHHHDKCNALSAYLGQLKPFSNSRELVFNLY